MGNGRQNVPIETYKTKRKLLEEMLHALYRLDVCNDLFKAGVLGTVSPITLAHLLIDKHYGVSSTKRGRWHNRILRI